MGQILALRRYRFTSGERYPALICADSGAPAFYPNLYLTTQIRNAGKQSNTMGNIGTTLMVAYAWAAAEGIDLEQRLLAGRVLTDLEMDNLRDACYRRYPDLVRAAADKAASAEESARGKVRSTSYRLKKRKIETVETNTAGLRMFLLRSYLVWLVRTGMNHAPEEAQDRFLKAKNEMEEGLKARNPRIVHDRSIEEGARQGLTHQEEERLRTVIHPDHPENPWPQGLRLRNYLVVLLMLGLAVRKGELLNLRITDISLQKNTLEIRRLPDNPDDPRTWEPNTKTLARTLAISEHMADLIQRYIVEVRRKEPAARRHTFLVTAHATGQPLSLNAFYHIVSSLRRRIQNLPDDLCPHIFRHTWNDRFSEMCDAKKIPEKREREIREDTCGWKSGSSMAKTYTKRHTRKQADAFLIERQNTILEGAQDESK